MLSLKSLNEVLDIVCRVELDGEVLSEKSVRVLVNARPYDVGSCQLNLDEYEQGEVDETEQIRRFVAFQTQIHVKCQGFISRQPLLYSLAVIDADVSLQHRLTPMVRKPDLEINANHTLNTFLFSCDTDATNV